MGGTMKAAHGHNNNRRRWINSYVLMASVCCIFGCGILGIIGIHRFRERGALNLIIKEKDDQILSLHLLLQERARVAETKRKTEEMRMEMASLRSQKAELSRKVSEMRSTISSLREEQRAVELALQEKQNQSPQVEALKEELKQKQGEIEDLKLRLQLRAAEVGSNATMAEAEAMKDTSLENGGAADADRVKEEEAKSGKEDGVMKAADDQEPEGTLRFRGKHSYLMRAKGGRWRLVGKRTQVRSDGASTMTHNGLRNLSGGKPHASLEEPTKMEDVRAQENEHLGDESNENTYDKNEHRGSDVLGRKGAAERNGQEHDGRDAEESEDNEETEEI